MSEDEDGTDFTVWDNRSGNAVFWAATLEQARVNVERWFHDPSGFVVLDSEYREVYRWHGPLVTP
jgi:hypothetical protein